MATFTYHKSYNNYLDEYRKDNYYALVLNE